MISKATLSFLQSLKHKKYRLKYDKFLVEGDKIIFEAISDQSIHFDTIYCIPEKAELFVSYNVHPIVINAKTMAKISNLSTPPGILAVGNMKKELEWEIFRKANQLIYLEDINNPGNLGTLLRTAEWFGFNHVVVSPNTVDLYNPKVIQASMGSFSRLSFKVATIEETKDQLPNVTFLGASLDGKNLFEYEPTFPLMILIGSESHGLKFETQELCNVNLRIPSAPGSKAESLNAGVAGALMMGYMFRK